jgi:hypothetical protein
MSKIKTKKLLTKVTEYIQKEFGYKVSDSFSDFGDKFTVLKKNPKCLVDDNVLTKELKYFSICEFSVYHKNNNNFYVILDYRENQPFKKSKYWINSNLGFDLFFGRYEFNNRNDFYNHIFSDFGLTSFDRRTLEGDRDVSLVS